MPLAKCIHCLTRFQQKIFNYRFCEQTEECKEAGKISKNLVIQKAIEKSKAKIKKANNIEKSILKESLKTKSDYEKSLQKEINSIVRLIDIGSFCHSTLKPLNNKFDAGHVFPTSGSPSIRFNLFNIYAQSVYANQYLSGDQINFLTVLSQEYGNEHQIYVLSLKSLYPMLKLSIEDLKEKISIARGIVKYLKLQEKTYSNSERLELRKEYNKQIGIYL